jgi:hypothetical protein
MRRYGVVYTDLEKIKQNVEKRRRLRLKTFISSGSEETISQTVAFLSAEQAKHDERNEKNIHPRG